MTRQHGTAKVTRPVALPLGWAKRERSAPSMGFLKQSPGRRSKGPSLIDYKGDGHLMTLGPTGAGKSRGAAIPALLSHNGPAIVVDVKGELFSTTARYRRSLGQTVYKLDPWGLLGGDTDALNPLDLLTLPGVDLEEEVNVLSSLIAGPLGLHRDTFWDNTSQALNAGLIAYLATSVEEQDRRLSHVREMFAKDFSYLLATLLDENKIQSELARQEFAIFLQHPERETRPSVQSSAQQHFRLLGTEAVSRAMDQSTIPLEDFINHQPITLYIVIPPHKLESHGAILRIWLGILLQALSRRSSKGDYKTLFLIDEAAALGGMEPLKRAITLLRGYGVQVWTLWQDASQVQANFPKDWKTIANNSGVIQLLAPRNGRMAEEYAQLLGGISSEVFLGLGKNEQVLLTDREPVPIVCRQVDYLKDRRFAKRYDDNPLFSIRAQMANVDKKGERNGLCQ